MSKKDEKQFKKITDALNSCPTETPPTPEITESRSKEEVLDMNYKGEANSQEASALPNKKEQKKKFDKDTRILTAQPKKFINSMAPYLDIVGDFDQDIDPNSDATLKTFKFFRLKSCSTEKQEDMFEFLNVKMNKLFAAIHAFNAAVAYGVSCHDGHTDLLLGIYNQNKDDKIDSVVGSFLRGTLSGIDIEEEYDNGKLIPDYKSGNKKGIISSIPVTKIGEERQKFDISALMRSQHGKNYTVFVIARPMTYERTQQKYNEIIHVRDACFAVSKRNISAQENEAIGRTTTYTNSITKTRSFNLFANIFGNIGIKEISSVGGGIGGGIGWSTSYSKSVSEAASNTIGSSKGISYEVQNGFAVEMISFCNKAIERIKESQQIGMWESTIAYSADTDLTERTIQAFLCGELSKPAADSLPLRVLHYEPKSESDSENKNESISESKSNNNVIIPNLKEDDNPLFAPVTSEELGLICTPPFTPVPGFELRKGKLYPMISEEKETDKDIYIGDVTDGQRPLDKMRFCLSENDLNKHTFICGITGSGKTTTVKSILSRCKKPFMVIESAKREYRNIGIDKGLEVYTLGNPEINCLQFNPFYVQLGVNVQMHIDFLKDLFNASFSFYGPMTYILEKCLYNIYLKKGWNITLGYHPKLINLGKRNEIFNKTYQEGQYNKEAHRYLFPTMADLKKEVKRYIEEEMKYDSEVGGNIKTAILARLESMCVGCKGLMFNTTEPIKMDELLKKKVVFELEGLSDDSDKAFCVGLLVIFIKEYRQINKPEGTGLQHLLVIEEAHRLLKNVETERTSENMGNPKGKAVEHFTNMIAEMRSYGQGVIIAEQIPSKLAPDVIKNSSNKIIQRVVSADDQALIANTVGIRDEDALLLGNMRQGYGLCHKEGMDLPVQVSISKVKDRIRTDKDIMNGSEGCFSSVNISIVQENTEELIRELGLKILNALLAFSLKDIAKTIMNCKIIIENHLRKKDVDLVLPQNESDDVVFATILRQGVINYFINGSYRLSEIVNNTIYDYIDQLIKKCLDPEYYKEIVESDSETEPDKEIASSDSETEPDKENVNSAPETDPKKIVNIVKKYLRVMYKTRDLRERCTDIVKEQIIADNKFDPTVNIRKSIEEYFAVQANELFNNIESKIRERVNINV